jgi:malate dehydrogenase (oxaloacetate-decarboxylating)(NADP+)
MNNNPIIFALANPVPEIDYSQAKAIRPDAIIATGRSDIPNQINNVLAFPYLFRGALDTLSTTINEHMKLAAAHAIASIAREETPKEIEKRYNRPLVFGREYLLPTPGDNRLITKVSVAVAKAAMESGVARRKIASFKEYADTLMQRIENENYFTKELLRRRNNGRLHTNKSTREHQI